MHCRRRWSDRPSALGLPSDGSQVNNDPAAGIDPNQSAEHSDVVGGTLTPAGPRVPWAALPSAALGGALQVFASRFTAAAGAWVPEGQDRGSGVPSPNIHTGSDAENPSVAGGAAVAGKDPVP